MYAINVLAEGQQDLSQRFASRADDKFAGVAYSEGEGGVPILTGCAASFQCRQFARHPGGDHVIFIGEVLRFDPVGDNRLLEIRAPKEIARYIARKGSVAVDGTSLTTNEVRGTDFTINLIPHTLENTTLNRLQPGSKVNLEVDLIARYCERLLAAERE